MKQPQQKRMVDDLERRVNLLFDALNCETLSETVVEHLLALTSGMLVSWGDDHYLTFSLALAMENHDRPRALAIHVELLTRGSATDDIALWMSAVKQLIMRM